MIFTSYSLFFLRVILLSLLFEYHTILLSQLSSPLDFPSTFPKIFIMSRCYIIFKSENGQVARIGRIRRNNLSRDLADAAPKEDVDHRIAIYVEGEGSTNLRLLIGDVIALGLRQD